MSRAKFWGIAFLLFLIALIFLTMFVMSTQADAKPKPTHPVYDMTCLVHNGKPTWYVEPATSAHLAHGDPYCENPGDPPEYNLDYWMPNVQRDPACTFAWLCP